MTNYNFQDLSPVDFEDLVKDLLEKKLNLKFESFTEGRDSGIDLRYKKDEINILIQCKKSTLFSNLFNNLRKEVSKVEKLNPSRYIVCTSLGLTPDNKEKIKNIFKPYILAVSDVLGEDDLNSLLNDFPDVEKNNFKLWLPSINILNKILNNEIDNHNKFTLESIECELKIYVKNDSFNNAIDIINKNKYVIISGIPGIGKSTLAKILVYYYLKNGFEDFIDITLSVEIGYKYYNESKKQIFFFDDFLGTNLLDDKFSFNADKSIIKFINKINNSKNKILICTTREYILKQAKLKYDTFKNEPFDLVKCTIKLEDYTKKIKAEILYNHIFYLNIIDENNLNYFLKNKIYLKIINHKNYSPRIIELIIKNKITDSNNNNPENYYKFFIESLDNPTEIWDIPFNSNISELSKYLLLNFYTVGVRILKEELYKLIENFIFQNNKNYNLTINDNFFNKSLKELENSFIKINKNNDNSLYIEFQNPSIQDFLANYLNNNSNTLIDIINSALYINQLDKFSFGENKNSEKGKIILNAKQKDILVTKLINNFDILNFSLYCEFLIANGSNYYCYNNYYDNIKNLILIKIRTIFSNEYYKKESKLNNFLLKKFKKIIFNEEEVKKDIRFYIEFIYFFYYKLESDYSKIFTLIIRNIKDVEDFEYFDEIANEINEEDYIKIKSNYEFKNYIKNIFNSTYEECEDYNIKDKLNKIEHYNTIYDIQDKEIKEKFNEKIKEFEEENKNNNDEFPENNVNFENEKKIKNEDEYIENMFEKLREKY